MTELELLIDFHKNALQQGPGSEEETRRAFELTGLANKKHLKVADIGCGTGNQTFTLAKLTEGEIVAVDLFPEFLEKLEDRKKVFNPIAQIKTLQAPMDQLPFEQQEFDLIWSEGAIYNMGFEAGIKAWKKFLKPKGILAVSEITWITPSRPRELEDFWNQEYPEIDLASKKIKQLEENGFILRGYFFLNPESWEKNYYQPMEERVPEFLEKHKHSDLAKEIVQYNLEEIALYRKNKDYFSYGFYIAQKHD
ncbi:MAG: methyltransferase domain-containing protein [Algoriphagus sp.]|uniref:class I SAM-dependent methyltransferase n=1 Tax=Algoriphagus sp. TaxID=1872435 RepID=UPI001848B859|nr:class I SAM-dependent methyltransferase [Algoriphagus sp.]NVJ85393.1 methyltransferase domain-containing protein [Algoriphagus sp.]